MADTKSKIDDTAGPEGGDESRRLAKHWLDQINAVKDNAEHKRWVKRSESIIKRYRDERSRVDEDGHRRYNALWANVEILKPAFYGKIPLPVAERRFKDKDPAGRNAAQILERALRNEIEICGFNEAMQQAVSDYLLPGRGTIWVRYEPEIEESVSLPPEPQTDMRDAGGEIEDSEDTEHDRPKRQRAKLDEHEEPGQQGPEEPEEDDKSAEEQKLMDTGDRVIRESTPVDFVPWDDFFYFPIRARNWSEVTAVCKRVYMSRNQMKKRFGDEIGKKIPLQKDDRGDKTQNTTLQAQEQDKGQVYEIWDKEGETVYWVAQGYDYLADRKDDPLELEYFFPCPKPLFANPTTNTLVPVPDFIQYQDQAIQIDELTQRISMLAKACKVAGVYNAAAKDVQRLLNESVENELIPVDDWAAFAGEKGGVAGNMSLLPVQDIIGVINELMMVKQKQIEEMDRLTGINDIMRGTSDPRETLGGVRLKSNSSGTRLTSRQNEVARFARDTLRIMADIMSQHFSPQSLIEVSGALYEEGLGPKDMPSLTAMQEAQEAKPPPPSQPSPGAPPASPGPGGAAPTLLPGAAPPPSGGNVVPFPGPQGGPPGQPPGQSPGQPPGPPQPGPPPQPGMPPNQPGAPPGAVPPGLPPEIQAKIDALQRITAAIQLLRDERLRGFRVDIEVDSTIYGDQAQDKQDRNEFVVATTQYLQQAMMLGAQMPEAVPLLGKLLAFGARGHKIGRDLELAIEEFTEEASILAKQRAQNAQNQPNPEQMKAQLEMQKGQIQLQVQQSKAQADQLRSQAEIQSTSQRAGAEQQQAQAEVQRQGIQNQGDMMKAQAEQQKAASDMQMQQMQMQIEQLKLQIEYAKLKAMGEATQQQHLATQQSSQQGEHQVAQEQEHTKQEAIRGHHGTEQAKYQAMTPQVAPAPSAPKPAAGKSA